MNRTAVYITISLLLVVLVIGLTGCEKPQVDYTYTLQNVAWSNEGSDYDADGYVTNRNLRCEITLLEPVERPVILKIYYQPTDTREYLYYHSITDITVIGGQTKAVTIPIGLVSELSRGSYRFLLELYELDNARLEASYEIEGGQFERLVNDQVYDMNVWWSDPDDQDQDGFPRTATLNVDVNVEQPVQKEIMVEAFYRGEEAEAAYERYYKGSYFTIIGDAPDTHAIPTGFFPDTLTHGYYDFKVVVWERGVYTPVLIYEAALSDDLGQIPFETEWDDGFVYALNPENMGWSLPVDLDGDGYAQARTLLIDVDIDKPDTVEIFAKIYRRGPTDTLYYILDSTDYLKISGSSPDDAFQFLAHSTGVTDTVQMPHGSYDFMISLFERINDTLNDLRFSTDSINGTLLKGKLFELTEEDI